MRFAVGLAFFYVREQSSHGCGSTSWVTSRRIRAKNSDGRYRLIGAVNKATCSTILSRRHRPVVVAEPDTWFPSLRFRSRIRSRIRFRNRFRKIRVRACLTYAVAAGACARQQRGRPRRQAAEFPAQKIG